MGDIRRSGGINRLSLAAGSYTISATTSNGRTWTKKIDIDESQAGKEQYMKIVF